MRKQITEDRPKVTDDRRWLDLEQLATVEVTSEDPSHPVEDALVSRSGTGWRASSSGEQTLRLTFDAPQQIRHLRLLFDDAASTRTQQFVIRSLQRGDTDYRDVVRQQFTFSPGGASRQQENYDVDLADVVSLELRIVPNISGGPDLATLEEWRVG